MTTLQIPENSFLLNMQLLSLVYLFPSLRFVIQQRSHVLEPNEQLAILQNFLVCDCVCVCIHMFVLMHTSFMFNLHYIY